MRLPTSRRPNFNVRYLIIARNRLSLGPILNWAPLFKSKTAFPGQPQCLHERSAEPLGFGSRFSRKWSAIGRDSCQNGAFGNSLPSSAAVPPAKTIL